MRWPAILFVLVPQLAAACTCLAFRSACQEVADSNLVFIGKVESMSPGRSFAQGTKVRFKVSTTFQHKADEDEADAKKDVVKKEDDDDPKFADVWNDSGDCGVPFQIGETYLVLATDDEDTNRMETNRCHRTIRLSDAGDELAYLYFLKNNAAASSRIEGFVTSEIEQLNRDRFHYSSKIKSPVREVAVELKHTGQKVYTETDGGGRFVFDGLAAGEYQVSVLEEGKVLSGPKKIDVQANGCALTTFLVLTRGWKR